MRKRDGGEILLVELTGGERRRAAHRSIYSLLRRNFHGRERITITIEEDAINGVFRRRMYREVEV
jgi:hypothetical protein